MGLDREAVARRLVLGLLTVCGVALLVGACHAQVLRVANHHATLPWRGWVRTTVDRLPQHLAGVSGDTTYRVGRQVGEATWIVDVRCTLAPGQRRSFDLAGFVPAAAVPPQLPANLVQHFGELLPKVNGTPMALVGLQPDGAAWLAHMRARVPGTRMLAADLWLWWWPDQPTWCHGEALLTCSNPAVPDLVEALPAVTMAWGDATVWPLSGPAGDLLAAGTTLADGQARAMPLTLFWPRHLPEPDWANPEDWLLSITTAMVARDWQIGAVGVQQLLVDGNPSYATSFSAAGMVGRFTEAAQRLRTWDVPLYGPAILSPTTGAQEDQTFVRGEPLLPGGEGAELVAWLSALKLHAERPCNHLEADGSPLDAARHVSPRLLFWDGRVHPSAVVSPDRLGKSQALTPDQARGRWGPDVEHWLANTLAASARLTGSPACQQLLRNLATVYLLQRTEPPSWSTTTEGVWTRALGWEGIWVVHCWRDLEDRAMAQQVVERWRKRCSSVILPRLAAAPNDIWDVRTETSASVPIAPGWMPWQQSIAAYGLDLACRVVGPAEGVPIALRGARRVVADTWVREGDRWVEYERLSLSGERSRSGFFAASWLPCALAVVLRHEPGNDKARSVWVQIDQDTRNGDRRWMPPGVQ